jgi:4-hydroxymandelate oxidase
LLRVRCRAGSASVGLLAALAAVLTATSLAQNFDAVRSQTKKVADIIDAPEDALEGTA